MPRKKTNFYNVPVFIQITSLKTPALFSLPTIRQSLCYIIVSSSSSSSSSEAEDILLLPQRILFFFFFVVARARFCDHIGEDSPSENEDRGGERRSFVVEEPSGLRLLRHRPWLWPRHSRRWGKLLIFLLILICFGEDYGMGTGEFVLFFFGIEIRMVVIQVVRHLILAGHDVHVVTGAPDFVFTSEIQSPRLFIRKVNLLNSNFVYWERPTSFMQNGFRCSYWWNCVIIRFC